MIPALVANAVVTIIKKQFKLDKLVSYVFERNELDERCDILEDKVKILESKSHPPRDFVVCEKCKQKIKEQEK